LLQRVFGTLVAAGAYRAGSVMKNNSGHLGCLELLRLPHMDYSSR
jgi:hypothetical protein